MTTLRNPDTGSIIQATGGLEQRLLDQGWTVTDQPAAPGVHLVTAAELDQATTQLDALTATVQAAIGASQTDRTDLRGIVEPMAVQVPEIAAEVDQLTATVEATTTALAPKPTPRTDALEAWRASAEQAIADIQATVQAIDIPAAVEAWLTANPPPAGLPGVDGVAGPAGPPGADSVVPGPQGPAGADSIVPGPQGPAGADSTVPGPQGLKGDTGEQGIQGLTGAASIIPGPQGIQGPAGPNLARRVIVNTGSLSSNTVKTVALLWPSAMPDTAYAVTALVESSTPQNVTVGLVAGSRTVLGCSLAVRSTVAVNAQGLNVHVIGLA